ncbi:UNVERIFIED_ORG: hypothetical protein M2435_005229 [Rhizobium sophorae]|nr:hypothetical protein [Rhizobium sophorae]
MVAITHGKGGRKPGLVSAISRAEDSHAPFLRLQRHTSTAVEDVHLITRNTCLEHGAVTGGIFAVDDGGYLLSGKVEDHVGLGAGGFHQHRPAGSPFSPSTVPSSMFIAGDPMKAATKRLAGFL